MANELDSMMGGSAALANLSSFFSGLNRENEALRQSGQMAQFNQMQQLSAQRVADRQTRLEERRLAAAQAKEERDFSLKQDESAFQRLNSALETQLRIADREAARRDKAFQNALLMEKNQIETRAKSLELQQLERQVEAQDLAGEIGLLSARMQAGEYGGRLGEYGEDITAAMSRYNGGMAFLSTSAEGNELIKLWSSQVRAARQTSTTVPNLSSDKFGVNMTHDEAYELVEEINWNNPGGLTDQQRQALGILVEEAERNFTNAQLAELKLPENTSPTAAAIAKIEAYAASKKGNKHWDTLLDGLKTPGARVAFGSLYSSGALTPIRDEKTLERLELLQQAEMMELAEMIRLTNGRYLIADEFSMAREDFEDGVQRQRLSILSGKNPNAAYAMEGGRNFDLINEQVMEQASRDRTASDYFEATGLPGAGRFARDLFTGNWSDISRADAVDAGLTAMMFVPGFGWAARGVLGVGKFVLGAGAKFVGRQAAAQTLFAGSRAAAAQNFARTAALPAARREAARAVGTARETLARREAGALARGAAREIVGAGATAATGTRFIWEDRSRFNELEEAKMNVESQIFGIKSLAESGQKPSPATLNELTVSIQEYISIAGKYFPNGKVPPHLQQTLFDLRGIVPPRVARTIQRGVTMENAAMSGAGGVFSNDDIRRLYAASSSGQMQTGAVQQGGSTIPASAGNFSWESVAGSED